MTDEQFIKEWNKHDTLQQVSDAIGVSYYATSARASRLRKIGHKVPKKTVHMTSEYYKQIGARGGRNGHTGGFYQNRELASIAGQKGGRISKRRKHEN